MKKSVHRFVAFAFALLLVISASANGQLLFENTSIKSNEKSKVAANHCASEELPISEDIAWFQAYTSTLGIGFQVQFATKLLLPNTQIPKPIIQLGYTAISNSLWVLIRRHVQLQISRLSPPNAP